MPKDGRFLLAVDGPWGGKNELESPHHIGRSELSQCANVVNRGGRIAPRPGYERQVEGFFAETQFIRYAASVTDTTPIIVYTGLSVDNTNDKIYAVRRDGNIYRLDADTFAAPTHSAAIGSEAFGCAVAPASSLVFWGEQSSNKIRKAALDLTSVADVTTTAEVNIGANVAVDTVNSKVVWASGGGSGNILRDDFAGGNKETIVSTGVFINGLAIDNSGQKIYFTDNGFIRRCNLGGTSIENVYQDASDQPFQITYHGGFLYWTGTQTGYLYRAAVGSSLTATIISSHPQIDDTSYSGLSIFAGPRTYALFADTVDVGSNDVARIWYLAPGVDTERVASTVWINKAIHGVTAANGVNCDDIMLAQSIDTTLAEASIVVYWPDRNIKHKISMGYAPGVGFGYDCIGIDDRDSRTAALSNPYYSELAGRASWAWTGAGTNSTSLKGGMLMADGSGAYVWNYKTTWSCNTIYLVNVPMAATGGNFRLTFEGQEIDSNLGHQATVASVQSELEQLSNVEVGDVVVTGFPESASEDGNYRIEFMGQYAGENVTLTISSENVNDADPTATKIQAGYTNANGVMMFRPAGLPRPTISATAANATGDLDGTYAWKITYYSTLLDLESPPSATSGIESVSSGDGREIRWVNPSTIYFDVATVDGGPIIDKVRVYRRRFGTSSGNDGVGASGNWFLVAETYAYSPWSGSTNQYIDQTADSGVTDTPLPTVNEYPPDDAKLVEVIGDRAVYAGSDRFLWISELPKTGGTPAGELGHEYVSTESFVQVADFMPDDSEFTALKSFGGRLVVGTPSRVLLADLTNADVGFVPIIPLEGTAGIASHWLVAETTKLPAMPGMLMWMAPNGHFFAFDGSNTRWMSRKIPTTAAAFIKKFWVDTSHFETNLATLYYSTLILDPENNRLIYFAFDTNGSGVSGAYSFDYDAWTPGWTITGYAPLVGRSQSTGTAEIYFGGSGGYLYKLVDGAYDDGASFAWSYQTARFSAGNKLMKASWHDAALMFQKRDFGGSDAAVAVTAYVKGQQIRDEQAAAVKSTTTTLVDTSAKITEDVDRAVFNLGAIARDITLAVSGTQTDNLTHPELVALAIEHSGPAGLLRDA